MSSKYLMFFVYVDCPTDQIIPNMYERIFSGMDYTFVDSPSTDVISFMTEGHMSKADYDIENNIRRVEEISANSKLVFIFESEHHYYNNSVMSKTTHLKNVFWCVPGKTYGIDNSIFYGWHTERCRMIYKDTDLGIDPYSPKEKYFDVLLGTKKPHRNFIYEALRSENVVMTYQGIDPESFIVEHNIEYFQEGSLEGGYHSSSETVIYNGNQERLSHLIPMDVFGQTAYSVVAETLYDSDISFFTEKISKPIIAKRLFIVFSGPRYLENLRSLGFRTFDGIVDESYDHILDSEQRWSAAMEQVKLLLQRDQLEVLNSVREICEHNYRVLMDPQPFQATVDGIRDAITKSL